MAIQDFHISTLRLADSVIVIEVSGEIDMTNSLAFQQSLLAELSEEATRVVLGLDAAADIDTTGLSVILELARCCGREDRGLDIVCSESRVRRALANTGLDQMIATHATLDEALGRGGPAP